MTTDTPAPMPGQLAIESVSHHVVVPYHPSLVDETTIEAVMGWGGSYACQVIDPESPLDYPTALAEWWEIGMDLVIVRQSADVAPNIIATLLACPKPLCARARQVEGFGLRWDLGIMKISASVPAAHPRLIEHALDHHAEHGTTMEWHEWDAHLSYLLGALGHQVHVHYPTASGEFPTVRNWSGD